VTEARYREVVKELDKKKKQLKKANRANSKKANKLYKENIQKRSVRRERQLNQ